MDNSMTIKTFSKRTGISKSTLRFYESKGLLYPTRSNKNSYRHYSDDQIPTAKLISSLRLAEVPIRDIQQYLESNRTRQQELMQNWIEEIKKKQQLLHVSLRYLQAGQKKVYLLEKSAEKIIWFAAESEPGKFRNHFNSRKAELEQRGIRVNNGYLRYLSGRELIKAMIGFGVSEGVNIDDLADIASIERMNDCLCVAISFEDDFTEVKSGYRQLISYAVEHNWMPTGAVFEWYRGDQLSDMDLVMPVAQLKMEGISSEAGFSC